MKLTKAQREHAKLLHRVHAELFNAALAVHNGALSDRLVEAALAFTEAFTDSPIPEWAKAKVKAMKPAKMRSV